ncbi:ABC-2 family transporter protein [compost metagenome]
MQVRSEIKNKIGFKILTLCLLFIMALIAFGMYRSRSYSLRDQLDLFSLILDGTPAITFPILAVLVYAASFSGEVQNRFLVYTRMRRPLQETLRIKMTANVIISFVFFFMLVFIPFLFVFYIEPHLVNTVFKPDLYGLTPETIDADTYKRRTFTQLLKYGTLIYGFVYALWVGLNGALYAAIAFYLVLTIRNVFLALSLPYIAYIISSFTLSALKLEDFRPNHAVFPFDHPQSPLWTALSSFIFLLIVLIALSVHNKKNIGKIERLL